MAIRKIVSRSIGTDVIAAEDLANNSVTVAEITDGAVTEPKTNFGTSTDSIAIPKGTTAQEPTAAEGHIRYDTNQTAVMYSDGSSWYKVSAVIPVLSGVSGTIYEGAASTLTLTGTGFLQSNLVVTFTHSSTDRTVTVTPSSDTAATVTTPSALDSAVSSGDTVTIKVTNSDAGQSGTQNTTVSTLPSGGTKVSSGGYTYHTFTSSSTFTSSQTLSAQVLMVAGGGGAGYQVGGGGGAGGLVYDSSVSISSGSHTVTIGAAGAGSPGETLTGSQGGNSSFPNVTTAIGGGFGNSHSPTDNASSGGSGGSGGGGGGRDNGNNSGGSGTSGQGNDGGNGRTGNWAGGGGGGAGAAGANSPSDGVGGDGGVGVNTYSTWATATSTGDSGYYAGGGGGCADGDTTSANISSGGQGGGGRGVGNKGASFIGGTTGEDGNANTGGGGGGVRDRYDTNNSNAYTRAGNGGSGIIIIRYADLT